MDLHGWLHTAGFQPHSVMRLRWPVGMTLHHRVCLNCHPSIFRASMEGAMTTSQPCVLYCVHSLLRQARILREFPVGCVAAKQWVLVPLPPCLRRSVDLAAGRYQGFIFGMGHPKKCTTFLGRGTPCIFVTGSDMPSARVLGSGSGGAWELSSEIARAR